MAENRRRSTRLRGTVTSNAGHVVDAKFPFETLTVNELKQELRLRGLKVSGLKSELVTRLLEDQNTAPAPSKSNNLTQEKEIQEMKQSKSSDEVLKNTARMRSAREEEDIGNNHHTPTYTNAMNNTEEFPHVDEELRQLRKQDRLQRQKIVLWRKPIVTLHYFFIELMILLHDYKNRTLKHKKSVAFVTVTCLIFVIVYFAPVEGWHEDFIRQLEIQFLWCAYWVGLGILSSVGLGTGLHTFLLYLGPHIATVTLSAWECQTLDFPEPPYPTELICPDDNHTSTVNIWTIMSKVRLEAFMWGAGTAIGELPPYFMARAARLSGTDPDDEELEELEELMHTTEHDLWTRAKKFVHDLVERVGFAGILLCASIPNPLFDLAGITCGHCLVPFWTFFGATLIGKAVIKMHIQKTFVILSFSKQYVETVLQIVGDIPYIGKYIQAPFKTALETQRQKLHRKPGLPVEAKGPNILAWIFEKLVILMIVYFLLSIVNSMAQAYAKKLDEKKRESHNMAVHKVE